MSARLKTAVRIAEDAKSILRKTRSFPEQKFGVRESEREHIGVEPILLSLSMELALKAWFVFDHDNPMVPRTHDLLRLFESLTPKSQEKLDTEFKRTVAPEHPNILWADYGIRHVLFKHKDAFVQWRYVHERKHASFDQGVLEATLEMALTEFDKRYWVEPARLPPLSLM